MLHQKDREIVSHKMCEWGVS